MMLLLHVLMLSLLSGGSAEVVQDFKQKCDEFFANKIPPTTFPGSQYKRICQTLNNVVHYATYYDTNNKIPVYSAYKFEGKMGCGRLDKWHIEPQLDVSDNNKPNMELETAETKQTFGKHQALSEDYKNSGSDRGHLEPVFHASSQSCSDATFTLTNAAPQNPSFNRGQWKKLEKKVADDLSEQCKKYSVYIVTGVVPGTANLNNRVNVPSHFWTAFCCLDQNNKCKITGGFIGKNEKTVPKEKTVSDLETELAQLYHVNSFVVFDSSTKPKARKRARDD